MTNENRIAGWLRPAVYLGHNPITLAGAVLTTTGAITTIGFWILDAMSPAPLHPYAGILGFLVLPGVFVAGLVLMPFGAFLRRRKLTLAGQLPSVYPSIDLAEPLLRRGALWVGALTAVNVALVGFAGYRSIVFMDSSHFCGETCHTVMSPEFTAYRDSPHSRVECVSCHIGPGANWFVKSKLSGTRQLFAVALKTYSRPIPSPVEHLRPARETCEQCHWPKKFHGDKFIVSRKYASDEANTPATSVLVLRLGGVAWNGRVGIHGRHIDDVERISYVASDRQRQTIPVVEWIDDSGKKIRFVSKDSKLTPAELAKAEWRKMDCMDCHNRPTHGFFLPERAVDKAMAAGRISPTLPFVKKTAIELLRTEYPSQEVATEKIAAGLAGFYAKNRPDVAASRKADVDAAAAEIAKIYRRNVFPEMKITWGTHPNNIGHDDFPGCFRCHDDNHVAEDGRTITQSCDACHNLLAQEEQNPKILADLGLEQ
jgi:hypothetical protein